MCGGLKKWSKLRKRILSNKFMYESDKINVRDLSDNLDVKEAAKRVRGLYYKNMIAVGSKGKKGEIVTSDALSEMDLDSLRLMNSKGGNTVSPEIKKFIEEMLGDSSVVADKNK